MKKLLFVLAMVLVFGVSNSYADYVGDAKTFRDNLFQELKQLEPDRISLSNENTQIDAIKGTYETAIRVQNEQWAAYNADYVPWKAEYERRNAETEKHNSYKPDQTSRAAVDAYNAEAAYVNNWRSRLEARKPALQKKYDDLMWSRQQLDNQKAKITEMVNAYNKKREEWIARKEKIIAKLAEYKQITDNCIKIIKDGRSDEAIHLGCGVLFDGSDPTLPTLESLGVKPGEKGWPGMKMTPNK